MRAASPALPSVRGLVRNEARRRRGHRVLDVGAGHGPWRALLETNNSYVALDLTPSDGLDALSSAQDLPIRSSCVDLVLMTEVLEHLPDPDAALREVERVLVPNGRVLVTVPFVYGEHDMFDHHRWTEQALRSLLARHGLQVIRFKRKGGIFRLLATIIDTMPYQLLVKRTVRFDEMNSREQTMLATSKALSLALAPFVWLLVAMDGLDRYQRFTLGFVLTAEKRT